MPQDAQRKSWAEGSVTMPEAVHRWDPLALYRAAWHAIRARPPAGSAGMSGMSGSYHENIRVETAEGPVLVRIPLPGADQLDLRVWHEGDVLGVVAPRVQRVPRLLHVSPDPPFQIHEFVPGRQLNELAPRGSPVPAAVIPDVLALFDQLAAIRDTALPPLPAGWPPAGDSTGFAAVLSTATRRIHHRHRDEFSALFRALGIPEDPLAPVVAAWPGLSPRPFRVLHADVHRRNIMMASGRAVVLDWELALWGDPVYDLAVHLNKMSYRPGELRTLLAGWAARTGRDRSWRADLTAYLHHERVKSAIVHSIRYARRIRADGCTAATRRALVHKLTGDLNAAREVWALPGPLTTARVEDLVLRTALG